MTSLGESLRFARRSRGKFLKDMQVLTGLSNGYLSQLESGKIGRPGPEKLKLLAAAYEVRYELLLGMCGYPPPSSLPEEFTELPAFVIEAGAVLQTEDWEALRGLIDHLVQLRRREQERP